jgi:FAD/FMN-containing dehydrogenase
MTTQTTSQQARELSTGGEALPGAARRLSRVIHGSVHLPGEHGYDEQRQPLHPTLDPRPAMVVEASGPADVRAAVLTAREHDLALAVQATGHGTHVASDGGLLLKTSTMATVLVDPDRRVARVGPGARWSGVLAAAAPFGLAPLSGSAPSVGVTGYTLGGGLGWLARKHGFAADSLLRAEVVTEDGGIVTASADQHPDLFWALRGGGGNFGVVTALEFRLHPVSQVHAGTAYYAVERAAETLARYRDWIADAPDALSTAVLVTRMPDTAETPAPVRGKRVLAIRAMHAGPADEAQRLLAPLRAAAGPALYDGMRSTRFADAAMGGTAPRHLDLLHALPDAVIETLVEAGADPDSPVGTVEVRHWGGAMARPDADAGPVGHRSVPLSVIVDAQVPSVVEALRPHATGGTFLNFLADPAKTQAAYTADDYDRLREVKRSYDPENVFRLNHNIAPAEREAGRRGNRRA